MATICIVACAKGKGTEQAPAEQLYVSDLFDKSREYAQKYADRWYILSARHGLVAPDQVIARYDETLNDMRKPDRDAWAGRVLEQLSKVTEPGDTLVFLAGKRYREGLLPQLEEDGYTIAIPMEHLRIGEQRHWLNSKTGER